MHGTLYANLEHLVTTVGVGQAQAALSNVGVLSCSKQNIVKIVQML